MLIFSSSLLMRSSRLSRSSAALFLSMRLFYLDCSRRSSSLMLLALKSLRMVWQCQQSWTMQVLNSNSISLRISGNVVIEDNCFFNSCILSCIWIMAPLMFLVELETLLISIFDSFLGRDLKESILCSWIKFQFQYQILILHYNYSLMIAPRTKLYVWGSDSHGQLGLAGGEPTYKTPQPTAVEENIRRIACGEKHILFVNDEGICFSQGCNENGELGIDNKQIQYSSVPSRVALPEAVGKVFCGLSYSLALLENREVYGWGLNEQGILGSFNLNISWKPIKINIEKRHRVKTISCGALHCGFVTENGNVLMCGSNEYGELGFPRKQKISTPTELDISFHTVDIACGVFYTLLLDKQGKVYSFGNNKYGQLGTGTKQSESFPRRLKSLENQYVVKISAGYHSGALTNRGELFIWGSGTFGEHLLPHKIELEASNFFVEFSIGGFFGAAIDRYGKVYTWGNNTNGELGQGSTKSIKNPTEIKDIKGIERIFCGHNFVVALPKQSVFYRSVSETPKKITFKNRDTTTNSPGGDNNRHYASIEKAVSNFKRTVNELQTKQTKLSVEKEELEFKLQELSGDYQKLVEKYELIETIVSEKERMIAIYEDQIRQSNVRLVESSTMIQKHNFLVQQNTTLTKKSNDQTLEIQQYVSHIESLAASIETYKKKFDSLSHTTQSLTSTNESLSELTEKLKKQNQFLKNSNDNLKSSERYLKSQIKNQKHLELEKGVEEIIKAKDTHIEELIKKNEKLINENDRTNEKLKQTEKLREQVEAYKVTIEELESSLLEREDEISEMHLQQEHERNIKKFTGFMCSPSERSDSKSRLSPLKIQCNRVNYHHQQTSASKQQTIPTSTHSSTNVKDLKRTIRQLENQIISISLELESKTESQTKLQRQIQEQMLVSAQLKQDIRSLHGSLTLTESEHTNSRNLLNKYESIITIKEQEQMLDRSKFEAIEAEHRSKEKSMREEIERLSDESDNLRERIGLIEERERESICIIRAQKRQIEDLRVVETDFDIKTTEYKKLLSQVSNQNIEMVSLREKLLEKEKEVKEFEEILQLQRQQFLMKYDKIQKELARVGEIKEKLYQNGNELFAKNNELEDGMHKLELQEGKMRCEINRLEEKLVHALECLEQSHVKLDTMSIQSLGLKKQLKGTTLRLNELQLLYNQTKMTLQNTTEQLLQSTENFKQINQLYKSLTAVAENKSQEISQLTDTLQKRQKQIITLNSTIQQISLFNKQYSGNETIYVAKIRDLEKHVDDLQGYLEEQDVNGRDMVGKNKELDRKNRELADMLNKAIEHQAIEYKHKIMYEVANNASMILENFNQNSEDQKENQSEIMMTREVREFGCEITNRSIPMKQCFKSKNQSPRKKPNVEQTPEQKYNKLLSDRILQNKKKITESANKLCELLDYKEIESEEKYSKINMKIESIDEQKEMLLTKLASYSEKLKHI